MDKKFRTYGPEDQKKEYHKRPPIEAVNSFLKTQYSMAINKVRGLGNVACLRAVQHTMLGSEQRSSRKHWKTRQSSLANLLQHIISGQGSALIACSDVDFPWHICLYPNRKSLFYCSLSILRDDFKHMKNVHALKKKRGKVPESLLLKAMRLLTYSPKKGLKFLHRLELTYAPNIDLYYNMGVVLLRLNKL